jgi:hypothetical protein
MPDSNKFQALRNANYRIPVNCGLCINGRIGVGCLWGTCDLHDYDHQKHTGPARGVSIHIFGTCPYAKMDPVKEKAFAAHQEFLTRQPG